MSPSHEPRLLPDDDPDPSLWQELADGSAGTGVKVSVSVALAPLLAGGALLFSYVLALSGWNSQYANRGYVIPRDEIVVFLMVAAGLLYLAAVAWVWTRNRPKHRSLWGAALLTVGITAAAIVACVVVEGSVRGAEEIVIGGVVCLAIGAVLVTWLQAARRYARGHPLRDRQDGALDVRCPSCGYRMVGLHESRCPECGTAYTLDELLAQQHFLTRADRGRSRQAALATDPPPMKARPESPSPIPPPPHLA